MMVINEMYFNKSQHLIPSLTGVNGNRNKWFVTCCRVVKHNGPSECQSRPKRKLRAHSTSFSFRYIETNWLTHSLPTQSTLMATTGPLYYCKVKINKTIIDIKEMIILFKYKVKYGIRLVHRVVFGCFVRHPFHVEKFFITNLGLDVQPIQGTRFFCQWL